MFQFLAITQAGCRRSFPRHLLHKITTLAISTIVVLVAQVIYTQPVNADQASRPNIVLIMADDLGYGDVRCYNAESRIPTPHIDRLAAEGMRFTDAHAPAAVCVPTRYGLLTGRYPMRMTRKRKGPLIDKSRMTIGKLLRKNDYATTMVGKWHLGLDDADYSKPLTGGPVDRGFDSYFGIPKSLDIPPYYYIRDDRAVAAPTDTIERSFSEGWSPIQGVFWRAGGVAPGFKHVEVLPRLTEEAVKFVKSREDEAKPFFLYFALPAPHTPWLPTKEYRGKSQAGSYGDFTMQVDACVGRVLATLDALKLTENTLVFFTSDNGPVWFAEDVERLGHAATGPLRGMKGDAWEGGHRMPFLARWPARIEAGSLNSEVICHTDMLATFASIVGDELPGDEGVDSYDMLPALTARSVEATKSGKPIREATVFLSSRGVLSIRQGRWKLITALGSGGFSQPRKEQPSAAGPDGQLYDLEHDLGERVNVYQRHPDVVERLSGLLSRYRTSGRSRPLP